MARTTSEIADELREARREHDAVSAERERVIEQLERGNASVTTDEAMRLGVQIDVLNKRINRLEGEHFRAASAETVEGYRSLHEAYAARVGEKIQARRDYEALLKRIEAEKRASFDNQNRAENVARTAFDMLKTYVPQQIEAYGERLLGVVQHDLEQIDSEFGMSSKHMGH